MILASLFFLSIPLDGYEIGMIAASGADLATTEYAAHYVATHPGWIGREANPFGQTSVNRAVLKVLVTTAVVLIYRKIKGRDPRAARWFALGIMGLWTAVSIHTLMEVQP